MLTGAPEGRKPLVAAADCIALDQIAAGLQFTKGGDHDREVLANNVHNGSKAVYTRRQNVPNYSGEGTRDACLVMMRLIQFYNSVNSACECRS